MTFLRIGQSECIMNYVFASLRGFVHKVAFFVSVYFLSWVDNKYIVQSNSFSSHNALCVISYENRSKFSGDLIQCILLLSKTGPNLVEC